MRVPWQKVPQNSKNATLFNKYSTLIEFYTNKTNRIKHPMTHYKTAMLLAGFLLMTPVFLQSQNPAGSTQYLTIVAEMSKAGLFSPGKSIYISQNGDSYKRERLDTKATEGYYDFNPVIHIIQKYNREGWKVVTSNLSVNKQVPQQTLYILMERKKPYGMDSCPVDTILDEQGQGQEMVPLEII